MEMILVLTVIGLTVSLNLVLEQTDVKVAFFYGMKKCI